MANFLEYNPQQAYLLPPTVRDVLGEDHLCFFLHRAVVAAVSLLTPPDGGGFDEHANASVGT
jgi:hypothetical protein